MFESLSAAEREQYRILRAKMHRFAPYSQVRADHIAILHSTPVGLLAAQQVFRNLAHHMVFLLADEKVKWFETYTGPDGWYWFLAWTIRDKVPERFADDIAKYYPKPEGFSYWVVTEVRGTGNANHELWRWDGKVAESVEVFYHVSVEDGFAEEWYE